MRYVLFFLILTQASLGFGQVVLGEMQSSNSSTIADSFGEYDDWIEIHNPTTDSVEISGFILKDQLDTWVIPSGDPVTHLPPNGRFLLWADDQELQGPSHTNFKLASGGEFLGLYEADGTTVIDSITIPAMTAGDSYVHCGVNWFQTSSPTPLTTNDCTTQVENLSTMGNFSVSSTMDGDLYIEIEGANSSYYAVMIFTVDGKLTREVIIPEGITLLRTNKSTRGLYIVEVKHPGGVHSQLVWLN